MNQDNKQVATIKLRIPLGSATPGGATAASLAQKGILGKMFYDRFNEQTKNLKDPSNKPVAVKVHCFEDKSFEITHHSTESTSAIVKGFLEADLQVIKGKKRLKSKSGGRLTIKRAQVEEIAKLKQKDLCVKSFENAIKTVEGTLRSMAINIEG